MVLFSVNFQGDFKTAMKYYQSTLQLQDDFQPAKERLTAIMCGGLDQQDDVLDEELYIEF